MKLINQTILTVALASVSAICAADSSKSPWTLPSGAGEVSFRYGQQSADRFFAGGAEMALPADLDQDNTSISFSYGLNDQLSIDLQTGYASSDFVVNPVLSPQGGLSGLTDSRIGLRYDIIGDGIGAITVGGALLIAGNYDTGALPAVGDGEDGFEASLLFGHIYDSRLVMQAGLSRREYSGAVPSQSVLDLGLGYVFTDVVSGGAFYQNVRSSGKLDIGAPGFSPARFPEVDEDFALYGLGFSVLLNDQFSIGVDAGRKYTGRNTAKSRFVQFGVNYAF
jgi:hypothetical protein